MYLPKSIAISGSGIIAVECTKILSNLGSVVTLVIRDNIPRNALMKIGLNKDSAATLVAEEHLNLQAIGIKVDAYEGIIPMTISSRSGDITTRNKISIKDHNFKNINYIY